MDCGRGTVIQEHASKAESKGEGKVGERVGGKDSGREEEGEGVRKNDVRGQGQSTTDL